MYHPGRMSYDELTKAATADQDGCDGIPPELAVNAADNRHKPVTVSKFASEVCEAGEYLTTAPALRAAMKRHRNMPNMTPRDIVQGLLGAAASKAPGGIGTVLKLIIDELIFPKFLDGWLFPKPNTDIFLQFKDRIEKMIDKQVEAAVGQAQVQGEVLVIGLGDAFRGYAERCGGSS